MSELDEATHPKNRPTTHIGQQVHYRSYGTPDGEYGSECRAATITEVDPERGGIVGLAVFNPTGLFFDRNIPYSTDLTGGTWHRPENG